ncbi:Elongator complex protein [Coemansia sp. RSA 1722]|nr:Elongator complex protein [Coemansia sp. RSA 486]KAJ2237850.1 Elongator complex protein [Coemansia sp. RSA 485]KAJ2603280.1 Elongator complex protein [Coemansia sp. RSA 1721]KAJ2605910.1 Elongator complex protein [Coemansia sp. RSA 1722]KAJ2639930.1 Elongator complex protein [Coemansia sp. RSA 1286]
MNTTGLSIRRLVSYQQYSAPLIVVSETAQQTALPFLEAMVRESITSRNMRVVAVCIDTLPSTDIAESTKTSLVDQRPSIAGMLNNTSIDNQEMFVQLQSAIDSELQKTQSTTNDDGVLVAIDSLDRLLRASQTLTLMLLRKVRKTVSGMHKARVVARFSRDAESGGLATNSLRELADAAVDVHAMDDLKTWMPGWYSDGRPRPFMACSDNDYRRGLVRLEHKRQSGKVGLEVATFEIDARSKVLRFSAVDVATEPRQAQEKARVQAETQKHVPTQMQKQMGENVPAEKPVQTTVDPAANLSFNLSLTDRQRQDRAKVELPYLDAQVEPAGEIHYQMDDEDDWDDEDPDEDLEI